MEKIRNNKGFTLVEILVIVGIIALLAAIAIPNLQRAKVAANESAAQATLKMISNSLENYAVLNNVYPGSSTLLTVATPPYLNTDYFNGTHAGYTFTSTLADYSYSIVATPSNANVGKRTFTITTGGVLSGN